MPLEASAIVRAMVCIMHPSKDTLSCAKKHLRYTNPAYVRKIRFGTCFGPPVPKFCLGYMHDEAKDHLWVPRAWFRSTLALTLTAVTQNDTVEVPAQIPEPLLGPLPHQLTALTELIGLINRNDFAAIPTDTYLVLPPSEGKTILGMLAMHCIGQKALVIVPTKEIEETWLNDANKVFGSMHIGRIRGDVVDHDSPITIGSIQTLMKLDPLLWANDFGLVVYDELHRLGGEVFANTIKRCRAHIRLGLTATDFRRDGRFVSVRWHLGDPIFKTEVRTNSVPLVYHPIRTTFGLTRKLPSDGEYSFNDLLEDLESNPKRNAAISAIVSHIISTKPGDILVVSPRVKHLAAIQAALEAAGMSPVLITGATPKRKELFAAICAGTHRITLATTSIMSEGASNPRWHHVLNTMPFSDPKVSVQLSGRCIRKGPNKTEGYFWDLVDTNPMCRSMYAQRWKALKRFLKDTRLHTVSDSQPYTITQ